MTKSFIVIISAVFFMSSATGRLVGFCERLATRPTDPEIWSAHLVESDEARAQMSLRFKEIAKYRPELRPRIERMVWSEGAVAATFEEDEIGEILQAYGVARAEVTELQSIDPMHWPAIFQLSGSFASLAAAVLSLPPHGHPLTLAVGALGFVAANTLPFLGLGWRQARVSEAGVLNRVFGELGGQLPTTGPAALSLLYHSQDLLPNHVDFLLSRQDDETLRLDVVRWQPQPISHP